MTQASGTPWTAAEQKKLLSLWNGTNKPARQIAVELGRGYEQVRNKIRHMRRTGHNVTVRRDICRRGRIPLPEHVHPVVLALFEEMNNQGATIEEVATRAGLHASTIYNWRNGPSSPDLVSIDAAFGALGLYVYAKRPWKRKEENAA